MPRYHFHLVDGAQLSDVKGITLSDDAEARRYAEQMARSWGEPYRAIRVVSEGNELFRVQLPDEKKSK
jgi:hypothetical protein